MRITSKGQVTIPKDIREEAGLLPGCEVEFTLDGHDVRIAPSTGGRRSRGRRIVESLRGRGDVKMTTDEIMALMRGDE